MDKVLAFDTERGLIEMESGMQWPQLLEQPGGGALRRRESNGRSIRSRPAPTG